MSVQPLPTPSAPPVAGPYSTAVRAGDWLVLAGQVGLDPATGALVTGGVEAEAAQALANVSRYCRLPATWSACEVGVSSPSRDFAR